MTNKIFYYALVMAVTLINAAPPLMQKSISDISLTSTTQKIPIEDIQLVHPHVLTIERLETLLRRAGEIFRPVSFQLVHETTVSPIVPQTKAEQPQQQMQPPMEQPYNFYLPLYDYISEDLDEKSRNMEKFKPPPVPRDTTNYYAVKPKKIPKKFNAEIKQINLKWLNKFEKEALSDANGQLSKAVYLINDERSRINFDDSFFAVDTKINIPDNEPHKHLKETATVTQTDGYLNQDEQLSEEDLLAVSAVQVPNIRVLNV